MNAVEFMFALGAVFGSTAFCVNLDIIKYIKLTNIS